MDGPIAAVDTWINLNPPRAWMKQPPRGQLRDAASLDPELSPMSYLIKDITARQSGGATPDQIVELMDRSGIEKAILSISWAEPQPALDAIQQHPARFAGALNVDPHQGMEAVRKLERMVKEYPFIKAAKVAGHTVQKPYNDRIYYPIYAKCIELDIPITANVGLPGPRVRSEAQHPVALDEVCWFFPELKVVMTHGGEPWQLLCVKLMVKWPNLFFMTSAFAPRYYPQEIVHYMNTRGADKVMFASGYPLLSFDRCVEGTKDLTLKDHVRAKFLRENAIRVFKLDQ